MLEKFNSVSRAVSLFQSVLVSLSAKQGKVITTELLDGMTQKAEGRRQSAPPSTPMLIPSYPLKSMMTMTSSSTSSTSTVRRYFATVGGMGDQETQVEGRVIASSAIMDAIGRVSRRGLSAWPQGTRRPQGTTIPVGNRRMLLKMVTMMTRTILKMVTMMTRTILTMIPQLVRQRHPLNTNQGKN
jgi:hypothetical protein